MLSTCTKAIHPSHVLTGGHNVCALLSFLELGFFFSPLKEICFLFSFLLSHESGELHFWTRTLELLLPVNPIGWVDHGSGFDIRNEFSRVGFQVVGHSWNARACLTFDCRYKQSLWWLDMLAFVSMPPLSYLFVFRARGF